eukprot:8800104-Karenia_brevis.AAC.1
MFIWPSGCHYHQRHYCNPATKTIAASMPAVHMSMLWCRWHGGSGGVGDCDHKVARGKDEYK